jgi:hypothetical protein
MMVGVLSDRAHAGERKSEPLKRLKAPAEVHSLAASPVGNLIAIGCGNGDVLFLNPSENKLVPFQRLPGCRDLLGFTPDGKHLVAFSTDTRQERFESVGFYDVRDGKKQMDITLPEQERFFALLPRAMAFSPDGSLFALGGSRKGEFHLWDMGETPKLRRRFETLDAKNTDPAVQSIAFSKSGRIIASAHGDDTVRVWEVLTGRQLYKIRFENKDRIFLGHTKLAISPDGWTLAWINKDSTSPTLYEVATGRESRRLKGFSSCYSVVFSPGGRYLLESGAGLWDLSTGKELKMDKAHAHPCVCGVFSGDGRFVATASLDKTICIWPIEDRKDFKPISASAVKLPDLDARLMALGDNNPGKAYESLWLLSGDPRAVSAMKRQLEKVQLATEEQKKRVAELLPQLSSDSFTKRDNAMKELRGMGESAEPFLRRALLGSLPAEGRKRVLEVLDRLSQPSPQVLFLERAAELLEFIATQEARHLLRESADRFPEVFVRSLNDSLDRLNRKSSP